MRRTIFSDEHEHFRAEFRRFAEAEIAPHLEAWNESGLSDRAVWKKMEGQWLCVAISWSTNVPTEG